MPRADRISDPAAPIEELHQITAATAKLLKASGMRKLTRKEWAQVKRDVERVRRANTPVKARAVDPTRKAPTWDIPEVVVHVRTETIDDPGSV